MATTSSGSLGVTPTPAPAPKKEEASFARDLVKSINDKNATVLSDGLNSSETSGWIDTGSYILNALISGSIFGGMPDNKILGLAGESATGKTFFALGIMRSFLEQFPKSIIAHSDTESATTKAMMESRGIDPTRVIINEPPTIERFRSRAFKTLEGYKDAKNPPRMMMVLDSLGNLSTEKEVNDIGEEKDVRDMTRTQLIRGAFRVLTLKLAKVNVPMIVCNHTYQTMDMYSPDQMSGGGGLKYAASTILFLTKAMDRDGMNVVGSIISCTTAKSRFTREKVKVKVKLNHKTGLDRYYGLLELAEKYGIFEKSGNQFIIDGKKRFGKYIDNNPEKFYTEDVLRQLDEAAATEFLYGNDTDEDNEAQEGLEEMESEDLK